jgi:hypothetical protein
MQSCCCCCWPAPSTATLDRLGHARCDDSSSMVHW